MARIRSIKPDFWTDEKVVELSAFARLLFIGLWNFADDDGRMTYSPTSIKLKILPADDQNISGLLGELRGKSLVTVYAVDGIEYLQINGFSEHQKIDKRTASKFPSPPNSPESRRKTPLEGKGMEGKGKDSSRGQAACIRPEDVPEKTWNDFLAIRKAKRAPLTETALNGIRTEAEKSGLSLSQALDECCARGWQGFKADWMAKQVNGKPVSLKPWFIDSSTAITAKGRELGIPDCDSFPEYRLMVFKAAGITPEMVKQAEAMTK